MKSYVFKKMEHFEILLTENAIIFYSSIIISSMI